jgi:hypothetical protein
VGSIGSGDSKRSGIGSGKYLVLDCLGDCATMSIDRKRAFIDSILQVVHKQIRGGGGGDYEQHTNRWCRAVQPIKRRHACPKHKYECILAEQSHYAQQANERPRFPPQACHRFETCCVSGLPRTCRSYESITNTTRHKLSSNHNPCQSTPIDQSINPPISSGIRHIPLAMAKLVRWSPLSIACSM